MSLYNLPPWVFYVLPYLAAAIVAGASYFAASGLRINFIGRAGVKSRLENLATNAVEKRQTTSVVFGSQAHRLRIAFAAYRIDVAGNEEFYLYAARVVLGIVLSLVMFIVGFPPLSALAGLVGGWIFVDGAITRAWSKTKTDIEAEIPSFLTRMSAVVQTSSNVPGAVEVVSKTLRADGPLRDWLTTLVTKMLQKGQAAMPEAIEEASTLSPSLAICAELLARMWSTGGEGYGKAFGAAADNLESVLDARVSARAKGDSVRGTVNILTALTFGMIAFLRQSPAMADLVMQPLVQVAYAIIALMIVYGYNTINQLIDESI